MKVLQIAKYYPPHLGGMETAVRNICETLSGQIEVRVIASGERRGVRREVLNGVDVTRLSTWGTLFSQPLTAGVYRAIHESDTDLIHIHEPNPLAMVAYLAANPSTPLVIHYHSDIVKQKQLRRLYWPLLRRAMDKAAGIIVGSSHLVDNSPILSAYRDKCEVIPFGINQKQLQSIERAPSAATGITILAVGRLIYYKGFEYLIDAMRHVQAKLVIVGDGPDRQHLERRIALAGLTDRVHMAGSVSDDRLTEWYRRADIFCLPSCEPSEAFGLVMVEAMAAGLPVVSTDLPTGVRSVNLHGETGIVVPPRDAVSLGFGLSLLCERPELRTSMGLAGRRRASQNFSREVMAERIAAFYGRLLNSPEPQKTLPVQKVNR